MARTNFRGGGGRHGSATGFHALACCVLLMVAITGCNLNDPTSPNDITDLTGQTTNQTFNFTGSITVTFSSSSLPADDLSSVIVAAVVRDASGNPISNLTQVQFSTDLGAFNVGGQLFTTATATTFNGLAEIPLQSVGGNVGTATITARIGNVTSTGSLNIVPAALEGVVALTFAGGATSATGVASAASPLDSNLTVTVTDGDGAPVAGANISFRITQDTTADTTSNPNAHFVASRHTQTGSDGTAINVLRTFGPGVVTVVAELYDPNSGNLVGTSNRIILTTSAQQVVILGFTPGGGSAATGPGTFTMAATVSDTSGTPQPGLTVRFRITTDTTDTGASLTPSVAVTDSTGSATSSVTVPGSTAAASVSIVAEVVDSAGTVLATSNVIVVSTP